MKVLDRVWMLANEYGVIYCMGTSAGDVWKRVIDDEFMGTGVTKSDLRDKGYKAKRVSIVIE